MTETSKRRTDVLILTTLDKELRAMLAALDASAADPASGFPSPTYLIPLNVSSGPNYNLAVAQLVKAGNSNAASLTTTLIRELRPGVVLLVGIGGGIAQAGIRVGDIVVGTTVYDYEPAKVYDGYVSQRYRQFQTDERLQNWAHAAERHKMWTGELRTSAKQSEPTQVHFGPIASGEKVIASSTVISEILEMLPDVMAVAMEGVGAITAVRLASPIPRFLEIRGISDLADANKNDDWHGRAASIAAAFTFALLSTGLLPTNVKEGPLEDEYDNSDPWATSEPIDLISRAGSFRSILDRTFPNLHRYLTVHGLLSRPAEYDDVCNYLRRIQAYMRNDLQEKFYLPIEGKEVVPPKTGVRNRESDPFVAPIHQVILAIIGRSQGGDSATASIAAVSRQTRLVRNIISHLLKAKGALILLGEPGAGKTMTLQESTLSLASVERRRVYPKIPLYIRLGEFHVSGKPDVDDVRNFVKHSMDYPSLRDRLTALEDRFVIFFDGMDEMSRDGYSEHTEALSVFADTTKSKTLFSCRITDFSPRFLHNRLVILPFARGQISEYVQRYIQYFPIVIDGIQFTRRQLVNKILNGNLPIETDNPFVLWLLCLFLQNEHLWPSSRVEMLQLFSEENFERKRQEFLEDSHLFPEMNTTFNAWGRFAFQITDLNRGSSIPVELLYSGEQEREPTLELIRVGKACGVLEVSRDGTQEFLVRFKHHRFQEYFTACYIRDAHPAIEWLDKFDAPRWQETMLNLVSMGNHDYVLSQFVSSIERMTQKFGALANTADTVAHNEVDRMGGDEESLFADRVELLARLISQYGTPLPEGRRDLLDAFRSAVSVLARDGNPITQVKIMRACQNVPEADAIEALSVPLDSKVNWVASQALQLLSGDSNSRVIGSDIASELGYDIATETFGQRVPAYFKAIKARPGWKNLWALTIGFISYLSIWLFPILSASAFYVLLRAYYVESRPQNEAERLLAGNLSNVWINLIFYTLLFALSVILSRLKNVARWPVLMLSPIIFIFLLPIVLLAANEGASSAGEYIFALVSLGTVILFLFPAIVPVLRLLFILLSFLANSGIMLFYLFATSPTRKRIAHRRNAFTLLWRQTYTYLENGASSVVGLGIYSVAVSGLVFIALNVNFPNIQITLPYDGQFFAATLSYLSTAFNVVFRFIFQSSVGAYITIPTLLMSFMVVIIVTTVRPLRVRVVRILKSASSLLRLLAIVAVLLVVYIGLMYAYQALARWTGPGFSSNALFGLLFFITAAICVISASVAGLVFTWNSLSAIVSRFQSARLIEAQSLTLDQWNARIYQSRPVNQSQILQDLDQRKLKIDAMQFQDFLRDIVGYISEEPALSTYWELRNRVEEILKQERDG